MAIDPNLVIGTVKESAKAFSKFMKTRPSYEQKALKEYFEMILELKREIKKDKRNHHKILELKEIREMFSSTIEEELRND